MKKMNSDLWALFWTQFFGALNDNVFKNALIILITYRGVSLLGLKSSALVALSGGIFISGFFFLSATAGQLADRYEKTRIVRIVKQAEIFLVILAIIGLSIHNYSLLLSILFLFGIHSAFFGPLKYAIIPYYSSPENLVFSNAMISSGTFMAILFGTIIGGLAASSSGNLWGLKIALLAFAIAGYFFARKMPNVIVEQTKASIDWNFYRSSMNILKMVCRNSLQLTLILGLSWFWFLGAGLLSMLPLLAKNIFHANEHVATLMLFTFVLGMGLGPFLFEKYSKGKVMKSAIPISLIIVSFFIFDIALVINQITKQSALLNVLTVFNGQVDIKDFFQLNRSFRTIVDLFFVSFFGGIFVVIQSSELQRVSALSEISRIIAGNNIINSFAVVLASVLLMVILQMGFSLSVAFGVFGLLNVFAALGFIYYFRKEFNKLWGF